MARPRKESGYTLVYVDDSTLRAEYFQSKAELEESLGIESAPADALLFAGDQLAYTATTQTIVTIGTPTTRKGKQQPVKASDLPTGPRLNKDGSERKKRGPNKVKPAAVPANGDHKEAAKDGAQP